MEIVPFRRRLFYAPLCEILTKHGHPVPSEDEIPAVGWVAMNNEYIVAIGFLRRMEGNHALLDGLTTNPEASPEARHLGLTGVVTALIKSAKELKIRQIVAYTLDESVVKRALVHGFSTTQHKTLVLTVHAGQS